MVYVSVEPRIVHHGFHLPEWQGRRNVGAKKSLRICRRFQILLYDDAHRQVLTSGLPCAVEFDVVVGYSEAWH